MDFLSAEFCFEGSKIAPGMVRLIGGSDSPEVIPLVPQRFGFAHDLEMKKIRGHHVTVNVARWPRIFFISRSCAKPKRWGTSGMTSGESLPPINRTIPGAILLPSKQNSAERKSI